MNNPEHSQHNQEQLIGDLRLVIANAQELLKNTNAYVSPHYQSARAKLALALRDATDELSRFEDAQLGRMIEASRLASEQHGELGGEARILRAFR